MFEKILVANRGEIAVRIMRTCHRLGVRTVAVYSDADAAALHVRVADEAVRIGPPAPAESYLDGPRIIEAARTTGATAIHPGYGFLAENAAFARAVREAGLTFVGPQPQAIEAMGSKIAARDIMEAAGVPVVPGYHGPDPEELPAAAAKIGYPLLVKASAGGGGKGMRVVHAASDLLQAVESAQREAGRAFGDETIFLERYIRDPRHIEFQIFGDLHGNRVHLYERDCSVQRRHQKIIEESPSPFLTPALRAEMAEAALAAAAAVSYENAGTIEFIVDGEGAFYFLEMNTRLQVEHPVTEMVTGLDLVALQLEVAAGAREPWGEVPPMQGHAMEARLYAEEPGRDFLPSTGTVLLADPPAHARVDAGVESGDQVTIHYDPMIAKVIVHAPTRQEAILRLRRALDRYTVLGITTNLPFLEAVLAHPLFVAGRATTHFIPDHLADWEAPGERPDDAGLIAMALQDLARQRHRPPPGADADRYSPWRVGDGFRIGES